MQERPKSPPLFCVLGLLLPVSAGCRTTESKRPFQPDPPVAYHSAPQRAWDVLAGSETTGRVIHFASENAPEQAVYMVRNLYGQDLGWIDHLGRAYRLLPHHRDPAWVGTGTVAQGVERILRMGGSCTLVEAPLKPALEEASAGFSQEESQPESASDTKGSS